MAHCYLQVIIRPIRKNHLKEGIIRLFKFYRTNAIKVYNCTSGTLNPLSWEELGALTQRHSLTVPSKYIQWYPGFSFRTNRFIHLLSEMMFHFFPAFLMDTVLRLSGSKPM